MIQVKAKRRKKVRHQKISARMPRKFDFNFCPVNQKTQYQFELDNPNPYPVKFHFNTDCPFVFEPSKGTLPADSIQKCTISFTAKNATVLIAKTLFYADKEDPVVVKLSAIGKYPFISLQHKKYNFDQVLIGKK